MFVKDTTSVVARYVRINLINGFNKIKQRNRLEARLFPPNYCELILTFLNNQQTTQPFRGASLTAV
jgi:hypothetical protein